MPGPNVYFPQWASIQLNSNSGGKGFHLGFYTFSTNWAGLDLPTTKEKQENQFYDKVKTWRIISFIFFLSCVHVCVSHVNRLADTRGFVANIPTTSWFWNHGSHFCSGHIIKLFWAIVSALSPALSWNWSGSVFITRVLLTSQFNIIYCDQKHISSVFVTNWDIKKAPKDSLLLC